jgi:hypothetical protein
MHMLVPGAPMDSSASLRDRNRNAILGPTINRDTYPPRQSAYNAPNVHPPTVSVLCALDLATYAGCEFLISHLPGSPPGSLYSVRSS